jgi:hypothetical protein
VTPGETQTELRILRMADALKNVMVTDAHPRIIVCALFTILEHNPDLAVLFEDLCGSFVAKMIVHENRVHIERERNRKVG